MRVLDGLEEHIFELLPRRIVRQVEEIEAGVSDGQVLRLRRPLQRAFSMRSKEINESEIKRTWILSERDFIPPTGILSQPVRKRRNFFFSSRLKSLWKTDQKLAMVGWSAGITFQSPR